MSLMEKPLEQRGRLAGMPVPIKDLADVAGVRSTQGSLIFADHVPEVSDILVTTSKPKAASFMPSRTRRSSGPGPTPSTRCSAPR
jgi:Asp-tRNA(Asn)/Glu-tRNA(Gln) amidotransferase A subunit family amidase